MSSSISVCTDNCKILSYGLPSAAVLMTALYDATRDPLISLPPDVNLSHLIRHLSVLVSQLESVRSPDEPNSEFCTQAANIISRKLDQFLEGFTDPVGVILSSATPGPDYSPRSISTQPQIDICASIPAPEGLDTIDLEGLGDFNLENWPLDFDFDAFSSEWNIF